METRFSEFEKGSSSTLINNETLRERFGKGIDAFTQDNLYLIVDPKNKLVVSKNTPESQNHYCHWDANITREDRKYSLVVTDSFRVPLQKKVSEDIRDLLISETMTIVDKELKGKNLPSNFRKLVGGINTLNGWECGFNYDNGALDYGPTYSMHAIKKTGNGDNVVVRLDMTYGLHFELRVPVRGNFDANLKEAQSALNIFSDFFDLSYHPKLKYEFALKPGIEVGGIAETSKTFPDYFDGCLDFWRQDSGADVLRAIVGYGRDGKTPILLAEYPQMTVLNATPEFLARNIYMIQAMEGSNHAPVVNSHVDVFNSFRRGMHNQKVNEELSKIFPDEEMIDSKWLHMFVDIDRNGDASLREDEASNRGKDDLRGIIPKIEKDYGLKLGEKIESEGIEKRVKRLMFTDMIRKDAAVIEKKYGHNAASRFKKSADSGLINGNRRALEVYESFMQIINI